MLVSTGTASPNRSVADADAAALLEALAETGDALTAALVAHDLDGITAATQAAQALVERLDDVAADPDAPRPSRASTAALAARIGVTARRNAVLLESAWATDAAMLRFLAAAATEADGSPAAYGPSVPGVVPAGWLDRTA
jgi:hypothetical protein